MARPDTCVKKIRFGNGTTRNVSKREGLEMAQPETCAARMLVMAQERVPKRNVWGGHDQKRVPEREVWGVTTENVCQERMFGMARPKCVPKLMFGNGTAQTCAGQGIFLDWCDQNVRQRREGLEMAPPVLGGGCRGTKIWKRQPGRHWGKARPSGAWRVCVCV